MSFTLQNNSAIAVVTDITTQSSTNGSFTITSGSFPLVSGGTVSGTNTLISDLKGSPYGTIQLFLMKGNAQFEVYINSVLYSSLSYSSGICDIQVPILQPSDVLLINIDESELPTPSPTPSNTPAVTTTPTPTPSSTPQPTPTPSSTPAPAIDPASLGALYWSRYSNPSNLIFNGSEVSQVVDLVNGSTLFRANAGSPMLRFSGGSFTNVCDPSLSGSTYAANPQARTTTLNGDYGNSTVNYTQFVRFYWDGSLSEQFIFTSDQAQPLYDGTSLTNRWFQHKVTNGKIELNSWADPNTSNGYLSLDQGQISATANTWHNLLILNYQDGANWKGDVYLNGSFVRSNSTVFTGAIQTPRQGIIQQWQNQGTQIAESCWFDFKLSPSQITDLFTYYNSKYC